MLSSSTISRLIFLKMHKFVHIVQTPYVPYTGGAPKGQARFL